MPGRRVCGIANVLPLLPIVMIVCGLGCTPDDMSESTTGQKYLIVKPSSVTLAEGRKAVITVYTGSILCGFSVRESSESKEVCSVWYGTLHRCTFEVTGCGPGRVNLTVVEPYQPEHVANLDVTVTHVSARRIVLTSDTTTLYVGRGGAILRPQITDSVNVNIPRKTLQWNITDTQVILASEEHDYQCQSSYLQVSGVTPGSVTITASTDGRVSNPITLTVLP